MTSKTEQIILDAGLKEFAKKGYDATTTRTISKEAGFTETTIFRKFRNKKNLYDQVISHGMKKIEQEYFSVQNLDQKYEDPKEFLITLIRKLAKIRLDNIQTFSLIINDDNLKYDSNIGDGNYVMSELIKRNIPNIKVDPNVLGITIGIFEHAISIDKYHNRINDTIYKETLQKFIDNIMLCIKQ